MKKRIISIALVVVMIVAMIPATLLSASAAITNIYSYDAYYHNETITVDAQMDDIYKKSELIQERHTVGYKTGFDAYVSATDGGLYIFATIEDPTIGYEYMKYNKENNTCGNQDKFQVYFTDASGAINHFELGYYAAPVDGDTYEQDTDANCKTLNHVNGSGIVPAECQYKTKILRDDEEVGYAWIAEIYIPWTAIPGLDDNVESEDESAPYAVSLVMQTCNDTWAKGDGDIKTNYRSERHYCYSNYWKAGDAWSTLGKHYAALNYKTGAEVSYNTPVTTDTIVLDGKLDDIYFDSTKITDNGNKWGDSQRQIHFTTYTAATLAGLYLWTEVDDVTMNNINETNAENGDMVQYYLDWTIREFSHENNNKTKDNYRFTDTNFYGGWVSVDYEGYVAATNDLGNAVKSNVKTAIVKYDNPDWDGEDEQTQYIGYAIETFIPWSTSVKDAIGARDASLHLGLGVQVSDDETYNYEVTSAPEGEDTRTEEQKKNYEYRTSIAYDTPRGGSYYGQYEILPDLKLVIADDVPNYRTFIADKVNAVVLDGKNTDGEYDNATAVTAQYAGDIYRVVATDDAIYVLFELSDSTPYYDKATNSGNFTDYIDFGMSFGNSFSTMPSFWRTEAFEGTCTPCWGNTWSDTRWFNRTSLPITNDDVVATDSATGWTYEVRIDLSEKDKKDIADGRFDLGFMVQYTDALDNGKRELGYSHTENSTGLYQGEDEAGPAQGRFNYFRIVDRTVEAIAVDEVNVSLGESIDLNLYATLPLEATDAMVKVTFNEKEYYLNAKKTNVDGEYKFTFENIAPQALGDVIVADLIVDGQTISLKKAEDGFTVAKYLEALKDDAKYGDVVEALLLYGAAAQQYTNYKTTELVADLATLVAPTMNKSVKEVTGGAVDGAKIAAAGVHYANINKIFVKVEATDISKITFTATKNGTPIDIELAELKEGVYIAYTDGIKATEFGDVYTFTITDATEASQTLTYSVYSYAQAMQANAKNPNTKTLVNALYNYGVAATAVN